MGAVFQQKDSVRRAAGAWEQVQAAVLRAGSGGLQREPERRAGSGRGASLPLCAEAPVSVVPPIPTGICWEDQSLWVLSPGPSVFPANVSTAWPCGLAQEAQHWAWVKMALPVLGSWTARTGPQWVLDQSSGRPGF